MAAQMMSAGGEQKAFWQRDLQCVVLCSLKETCNILAEQDKVLESNLEHLSQKSRLTEYVKSILYDIANVVKSVQFIYAFQDNKQSDCCGHLCNQQTGLLQILESPGQSLSFKITFCRHEKSWNLI